MDSEDFLIDLLIKVTRLWIIIEVFLRFKKNFFKPIKDPYKTIEIENKTKPYNFYNKTLFISALILIITGFPYRYRYIGVQLTILIASLLILVTIYYLRKLIDKIYKHITNIVKNKGISK